MRGEEKASPMKRIMRLVWKNWYLYIPSVLATMAYLILDMVMGKLTGETLDAAAAVDGAFWNRLAWMIAAPFLAAPFHTISMLTKFRMSSKVVMELRVAVGRKAMRLSIPALEEQRSGDIMAHLGSELDTINGFAGYGLSMITTLFTSVFGTMIFMSVIDIRMTVLFMGASLLVLPVSLWISRPFKDMEEALRTKNGLAQQAANEGLQAAAVVKSFQLEGFVGRRFREALGKSLAVDLRMQKATAAMNGTGVLLGYLPMMAMLAFGALRVSQGTLTVGMLLSLTVVSKHFVTWLTQVPDVFGYIQKCSGACTRLFRYLDLPEESGGTQTEPVAEAPFVEFEDVSFSYPESHRLIEHLGFSVKEGETVALVGASGSGKSTALKIICGFLMPEEGQVRVRGPCRRPLGPWPPAGSIGLCDPGQLPIPGQYPGEPAGGRQQGVYGTAPGDLRPGGHPGIRGGAGMGRGCGGEGNRPLRRGEAAHQHSQGHAEGRPAAFAGRAHLGAGRGGGTGGPGEPGAADGGEDRAGGGAPPGYDPPCGPHPCTGGRQDRLRRHP